MELRVSWATAFTPALSTACTPTGTMDLIPRLRSLLGLPTCQPLPGRLPGLQDADQRRGCSGAMGTRSRALSGPDHTPRAPAASEEAQHTLEEEPGRPLWLPWFPPGTLTLWRSGTLHCTGSLHTGWGLHPTRLQTVGPPDLPAPLGPDTVPSWLGGPEPVSGNCPPRSGAGRGTRGKGRPQVSPALLTKSCYCGPCLQGLVPGPPTLEVIGAGALWVPFYCPSQGWSLGLGSQ